MTIRDTCITKLIVHDCCSTMTMIRRRGTREEQLVLTLNSNLKACLTWQTINFGRLTPLSIDLILLKHPFTTNTCAYKKYYSCTATVSKRKVTLDVVCSPDCCSRGMIPRKKKYGKRPPTTGTRGRPDPVTQIKSVTIWSWTVSKRRHPDTSLLFPENDSIAFFLIEFGNKAILLPLDSPILQTFTFTMIWATTMLLFNEYYWSVNVLTLNVTIIGCITR